MADVAANELILDNKLAPKEAGAGLPAVIPQGMRALSVAVNDVVGVAGFVTPGTMVDVLVTGKIEGGSHGTEDTITRTILENVRVLAAGQKIEQDREGKPQTVPVITLLVSPEDAGRLAMAMLYRGENPAGLAQHRRYKKGWAAVDTRSHFVFRRGARSRQSAQVLSKLQLQPRHRHT